MIIQKKHAIRIFNALGFQNVTVWPNEVHVERLNRLGEVLFDKESPFDWDAVKDGLARKKLKKISKALKASESITVGDEPAPQATPAQPPAAPEAPETETEGESEDEEDDEDDEEDDSEEGEMPEGTPETPEGEESDEEEEEDDSEEEDDEEDDSEEDDESEDPEDKASQGTPETPEVDQSELLEIIQKNEKALENLMEMVSKISVVVLKIRKTQKIFHTKTQASPAPKKVKAPTAKTAPAAVNTKIPLDRYGTRIGTGRHKINLALTKKAQLLKVIAKAAKQSESQTHSQLKALRDAGWVGKNEKGYFLKK